MKIIFKKYNDNEIVELVNRGWKYRVLGFFGLAGDTWSFGFQSTTKGKYLPDGDTK